MNVPRQINGHVDGEAVTVATAGAVAAVPEATNAPGPLPGPSPVCMAAAAAAHITNGSLATPSPRAPTSAGDVHEEFFGDDPLPDHDWELRNLYIPDIPADLSADELRHVMATFGHVEDVQLIGDAANGQSVAGHVVFRLADEAECAKSALSGRDSLATLRELTPMRRSTTAEEQTAHTHEPPEEPEAADPAENEIATAEEGGNPSDEVIEGAAVMPPVQQQHHHHHHHHQQQQQASRTFQRYHVQQANYGRPMVPLPYMVPPAQAAAPWGGGSLYYPMSPAALHPIYGALPAHANYLAMAPAPPAPVNPAAHHRKAHRGSDDNDGPCVRLVVHTRLVGAIIGVGGATIRKITRHQVRVDVDNNIMKRPWPPSNGRGDPPLGAAQMRAGGPNTAGGGPEAASNGGGPRALQSQVVFIYGALEAVERAVLDIMKLIQHEAHSKKLDHEPDLALLVENTLCGRIIGKGGHKIKKIRENSDVDIVLCNETIVRYDDVYHVYLAQHQFDFPSMRIISVRGDLERSMEAFRQLVTSINEIRRRSPVEPPNAGSVFASQMPPLAGLIPPRAMYPTHNLGMRPPAYPPYMPLAPARLPLTAAPPTRRLTAAPHTEEPQEGETAAAAAQSESSGPAGPVGLHLDLESLYVLVPHSTGGAIIGTEGRNIHKMMEVTGASVSVSKHQPPAASPEQDQDGVAAAASEQEAIDGEPKRLVTIRAATEQSLDLALLFIFRKVQSCRREALSSRTTRAGYQGGSGGRQPALIYTVMRAPKALMGRLCGRHHQNVANIERQSGAHIEMSQAWFSDLLPSNKAEDNDGVEFDNIFIKGEHQATQVALTQLRHRLLEAFYAYSHQTGLPVSYPYASAAPPAAMAAALAAAIQPMMPMAPGPHVCPPGVYNPMAQAVAAAQFAAGGPAFAAAAAAAVGGGGGAGAGGGHGSLPEGVQLYRLTAPPMARPVATQAVTPRASLDGSGGRQSLRAEAAGTEGSEAGGGEAAVDGVSVSEDVEEA